MYMYIRKLVKPLYVIIDVCTNIPKTPVCFAFYKPGAYLTTERQYPRIIPNHDSNLA